MAIFNENGVPLLDVSDASRKALAAEQAKATKAWEAARGDADPIKALRLGARVFVHNKAPRNTLPGNTDVTAFTIGGATLDEAIKDVVGGFAAHVRVGDHVNTPDWVSSTDPEIAALLAEHWSRDDHAVKLFDPSEVAVYAPPNLQNNRSQTGLDIESGAAFQFASMFTGTSTAVGTTSLTTASTITLNSVVGQYVVTGNRFGIVQSNTAGANSVLTIDRWYDVSALPANRGVAAASNPATGVYMILPGNVGAGYIGLTATTTAISGTPATETTLAGEITTSGGGMIRTLATYAHTSLATTTTLTNTWTMNATDSKPVTVHRIGVFQGVESASRMFFITDLNADATLTANGDQLQVTETVTL